MCCYSSGYHPDGISWADQCPSEDESGPVSGGEEHTSCIAMDGDTGEETPHEMNRTAFSVHDNYWHPWVGAN